MARWSERLGFSLLAGLSALLSWAAWSLPPRADPPAPPPPLDRPPTDQEQATVTAQRDRLQRELDEAAIRLGQALPLRSLEGLDPQGQPWLPSGLPDNPLRPGVAGVLARCPATARPDDRVDWIYCEQDGRVAAVGIMAPG